jgi:hypothetical protein
MLVLGSKHQVYYVYSVCIDSYAPREEYPKCVIQCTASAELLPKHIGPILAHLSIIALIGKLGARTEIKTRAGAFVRGPKRRWPKNSPRFKVVARAAASVQLA